MGGKSYFCDYCCCYMKNDKNVRKTHNEGLAHKIMRTSVMRKCEDPRKIYEEEINKAPCIRYFKSYCKYDLYCQFTHFNEAQLQQLKNLAQNLNTSYHSNRTATNAKVAKTSNEITKLPWENTISKKSIKMLQTKLPLSLRPLSLRKLTKLDVSKTKWE